MSRYRLTVGLLLWLFSVAIAVAETDGKLGYPLQVHIQLPSPGMTLKGLPPLAGMELLRPTVIDGDQLQLSLLPLQSGVLTLPPLPLLTSDHRQWNSPAQRLRIQPLPNKDLRAKSLKAFPLRRPGQQSDWLLVWLLLLAGLAICCFLPAHRRRLAKKLQADANAEVPKLKLLASRLEQLETYPQLQLSELQQQLQQLRFGPKPPDAAGVMILEAELNRLEQEVQS